MGEHSVSTKHDEDQLRAFTLAVLTDLQSLDKMLSEGTFENDVRRIGAEQELFLVNSAMRPAPLVTEVLKTARDGRLTTEIGRFNLEANLTPRNFANSCLREMEDELNDILNVVRWAASIHGAGVVLAGILPTIQSSDLCHDNMTPNPRYEEIDRVVTLLHGQDRVIQIKGLDELQITLQDTYTEFCNTSFQMHLQVGVDDFVRYYNWAQAISAPVLASAVNSPILLGHRLWHETRVALFQHATDTRSLTHKQRRQMPRVNFGDRWVEDSVIEVLREDAIRFRVLLTQSIQENSLDVLKKGEIPQLSAWRLHNGTIWRWNRPCYGVAGGRPGLRIEARYLPAGPSVVDEMANMAFFLGLMTELPVEFGEIRDYMCFDDAKANFFSVARYGLDGQIRGLDGKSRRVGRLIIEEFLPRARKGLERAGIDKEDNDRLLDVIEERVRAGTSGAKWMLTSYAGMDPPAKPNVRFRTLTAAMKKNQENGEPVHKWELASIPSRSEWIDNYLTVEQFMAVDLYTVRPEDVIDLAASLMHWRHVRHVPVEDDAARLIGIVSYRDLVELMANGRASSASPVIIRDIMKTNVITISPDTPTLVALNMLREHKIGCLPVVKDEHLVGIITAFDFLTVSTKLLEERLLEIR